jgi:YD repeat-containing protein
LRHSYSYDPLNRLTQDQRSNQTKSTWSYDGANNLTGVSDTATGATNAYCYDPNNTELLAIKNSTCGGAVSQSFGYNPVGDRTSTVAGSVTSTYAFNQEHELTSFTKTGGTSASYVYNGDGLRMTKTVNSSAEGFVWDISLTMRRSSPPRSRTR